MPFTFSHPAAVLPLKKYFGRLSLPALIAGSLSPDFEYFVRMKSKFSHTFLGVFWLDAPITILILFAFCYFIKDELIDNLPAFLRERFADARCFDFKAHLFKAPVMVLFSAALGALTHILWDSFTHSTGFMVAESLPILKNDIFFKGFPVYRLLQHVSTILGGAVICVYIYLLPRKRAEGKASVRYHILWVIFTAALYFILRNIFWQGYTGSWHKAISLITAFLLSLCLASLTTRALQRRKGSP